MFDLLIREAMLYTSIRVARVVLNFWNNDFDNIYVSKSIQTMLNLKKIFPDTNVNSFKTLLFLIRLINQYLLENKSCAERFNTNWIPILAKKYHLST